MMIKKVASFIISVIVLVNLFCTGTSVVYASNYLDLKNNETLKVGMRDKYIETYKNFAGGAKTFYIEVQSGTLMIGSGDNGTHYKMEIFTTKGKLVKTLKSEKYLDEDCPFAPYGIGRGVNLKKGKYKVIITSESKKKLKGHFSMWMYHNNSRTYNIKSFDYTGTGEKTGVVKGKTYEFNFSLPKSKRYTFLIELEEYGYNDHQGEDIAFELLDSKGNVVLKQNETNMPNFPNFVDKYLKKGDYTLVIKPQIAGTLETQIYYQTDEDSVFSNPQ